MIYLNLFACLTRVNHTRYFILSARFLVLTSHTLSSASVSSTSVVSHVNSFEPTHAQDAYYQSTKFPKISLNPQQRFRWLGALNLRLPLGVVNRNFRFVSDPFFASRRRRQSLARERII
jgi:hypothetical protein